MPSGDLGEADRSIARFAPDDVGGASLEAGRVLERRADQDLGQAVAVQVADQVDGAAEIVAARGLRHDPEARPWPAATSGNRTVAPSVLPQTT